MRRDELYVADLVDNAEFPDLARTYESGPFPEPKTGPGTAAERAPEK
jgi:hypothetical protein